MGILASHYYYKKGYRKVKIMKKLNEFMKKNYPFYKEGDWQKTIERYATHAKKRVLKEIDGIYITEKELDTIVSLNNKVLERLSFTLLCLAKLALERNEKSNGWVINEDSEIFRLARISAGIEKKAFYINDLRELGMIEYAVKNDNLNLQVLYIDGGENQNNVLYITDFRELGYEYLKYKGENFIRCADCDILVRNNKQQNKRYCSNCATKSRYERIINKTINCIDCGKEVVVDGIVKNKKRCDECQKKYNNSSRMKNYYKQKYKDGLLFKFESNYYLLKDNPKDLFDNGYEITGVSSPDYDEWYNEDGSEIRYPFSVYFEHNHRSTMYPAMIIEGNLDFM